MAGLLLCQLLLCGTVLAGNSAVAPVYLVEGPDRITAVNPDTGQFFDFDFVAGERIERRLSGSGVAVLITSQRFAAVGGWPAGWATVRRRAGERLVRATAGDESAVVVTSDRILSYSARNGSWSITDR